MPLNVWYGNDRWPSGRNLGEFAKDVFRIEGCKTDRDKAMAFFKWTLRSFMRGPNYEMPDGFGTYSRSFDPLMMFASFGHFECTGWGWVAAEALQAAGLKARRVVGQEDGHTIYEVWYKGKDGAEGWHAFDAFQGWWFLNKKGEVASCEELTNDHNLVHNPLGNATPIAYNVDLSYLTKRHAWGDALDVIQHVQNETLAYEVLPGQEYANLFAPADPARILHCGDAYPRGSHCQFPKYDHTGALLYPEHEPYWANYRVNFADPSWPGSNTPMRPHGAGALRWTPLLHGKKATAWADHAHFENNAVRPSGVNHHCEVWYKIAVPYLISYLQVEGYVQASGSDYVGLGISADGGKTISPLSGILSSDGPLRGKFRLLNGLKEKKEGKTSVQFTRQFHLRIDMHSHHSAITPLLEGLRITVGYQHNMFTQPFLLPGKNKLYLEGEKLDGYRLKTRWNYTLKGRAQHLEIGLDKEGRAEKAVDLRFGNPEEITLRGITLTSEKKN